MGDIFDDTIELTLPERVQLLRRVDGNPVKRLRASKTKLKVRVGPRKAGGGFQANYKGKFTFGIVSNNTTSTRGDDAVLKVEDVLTLEAARSGTDHGKWVLPKLEKFDDLEARQISLVDQTIESWEGAFNLQLEKVVDNQVVRPGMRLPQVGAIHAVQAHWAVHRTPATVVLPTGTGKTETMLAVLVAEQIRHLVVVVPTDALRSQIAEKFLTLGLLKQTGCLKEDALLPTVTTLRSAPTDAERLAHLLDRTHVLVATMSAIAGMSEAMQSQIAKWSTHLFVDEAHHLGADTWHVFKSLFHDRLVLQFTATPYRNDRKRVEGKHIFNYPLSKAQEDGLFRPITYVPIYGVSSDDTDNKIIARAKAQLAEDRGKKLKHLVMARVRNIKSATRLIEKYRAAMPEANHQILHSEMPRGERQEALRKLRSDEAHVIVCVNMLGEGFDLPELKIAALHDRHQSEAITMQFIGRFTRMRTDLGDATVVANVDADDVRASLKVLYSEDADWNRVLKVLGDQKSKAAQRRESVLSGFKTELEHFGVENLKPRMSTIIYRTKCLEWQADDLEGSLGPKSIMAAHPIVNAEERLLIFVCRDDDKPLWTASREPQNIQFNLVMAHWNPEHGLLFINTSRENDPQLHLPLARKLCGEDVVRVGQEAIFRVLQGFDHLLLANLGLSETQRRPVRYSMFMGSDIGEEIDRLPGNGSKTLNNLFGLGYVDINDVDDDEASRARASIGASVKGKVWANGRTNDPAVWMDWCHDLGTKILDETITLAGILRNLVRPKRLESVPADKVPLAIDWPDEFLTTPEDRETLSAGDDSAPSFDCEISIDDFSATEGIKFSVLVGEQTAQYVQTITPEGSAFAQTSGPAVKVSYRGKTTELTKFFVGHPPHVYFADGDMLVGSDLLMVRRDDDVTPFPLERLEPKDWAGVNIRVESQGDTHLPNSIQRRVIETLLAQGDTWDIIFDDDEAREVADVVAMKLDGNKIKFHLFHCKFSSADEPGARVKDLYEICGQAQKSVRWAEKLDRLLKHFKSREASRTKSGRPTRFQKGEIEQLLKWLGRAKYLRPEFNITLVQPGYSKSRADVEHLRMIAATDTYLAQTYRIPMQLWVSE